MLAQLDALRADALQAFQQASSTDQLETARVQYLGRKGVLRALQKQLGKLPPDQRPVAGRRFNEVRDVLHEAVDAAHARLQQQRLPERVEHFDVTEPGIAPVLGRRHVLTQTIEELTDILGRLGFVVADGPEVEDEWHNFQALNIPPAHPARDPLDNYYIRDDMLLRSQTSTVQIRVMQSQPPPVRILAIGRVYRPDTIDATHCFMFHQVEGLLVDRDVTMADLKTLLGLFVKTYLGPEVTIRFRPSFFPFTEPSVEVDMSWGERNDQWIELGGAGMVDPNVFEAVGYDPEQVAGFAFGLGIERLAMRRHGIHDIRLFFENDVRFLQQF